MDRTWISTTNPGDPKYMVGVREFIEFATKNSEPNSKLPYPCYMCHNLLHHKPNVILNHLSKWAFDRTYTRWIWHGEPSDGALGDDHMPEDNGGPDIDESESLYDMLHAAADNCNEDTSVFETLLEDVERPLYTGSKHSKL